MSNYRPVWDDNAGDTRKNKSKNTDVAVHEPQLCLELRRITSGKGRTVIEIKGLPRNKKWCQQLAKELKKSLGVGGTFKNQSIEIHGEKIEQVAQIIEKRNLKWKKTGG